MSNLTQQEIEKLSLGYIWNPDMSQEEFTAQNFLGDEEGVNLFTQIDQRYVQYVYEKEG